jgi:general L-amino acid transport system permease protein
MTIAAGEPPRRGFQPGLLLYDTRYRSVTIQVVALLVLTALLAFLGYNVVQNLRALDKEFEFSFLWRRAGYDISQALIPYTNNDTHARAALVGILNTLLVAGLGILLATVVGVIAGVLRLSKNWLVGRLMTVYVEVFRNVPRSLWIILVYAVLSESTPQPRDFAGEEPAASMVLGLVAFTNRGTYIPWPVWGEGASVLLLVLLLSVLGVWAWRRYALARRAATGRDFPILLVSLLLLVVPVTLAFLLLGRPLTFDVPTAGRFNFQGGVNVLNALVALWLALSLYTGAFIAEIVRAGILACRAARPRPPTRWACGPGAPRAS